MKKFLAALCVVGACLLNQFDVRADMIRMKNGRLIEGTFLGCAADALQMQTAQGIVVCPIPEILSLTFLPTSVLSAQATPPLPQATPLIARTPTPQPTPQPLIIAPGTRLLVRLLNRVDTIQSKPADWFTATLDAAIIADGVEVVPKGAILRGQVVQAEQGQYGSALVITLRELFFKRQVLPIETTSYTAWGKSSPTEADSILKRRRTLRLAEQTLIEFKTIAPLTLDGQN